MGRVRHSSPSLPGCTNEFYRVFLFGFGIVVHIFDLPPELTWTVPDIIGFFFKRNFGCFFVLVRLIKFQQRSVTSLPGFLTEFDLKKSRRPSHSFHPKGFSFNFPTTVSSMAAVSWCRSIEFRRQRTILCCCRFFV